VERLLHASTFEYRPESRLSEESTSPHEFRYQSIYLFLIFFFLIRVENRARHEKHTCLYYARSPSRDAQRVVQLYNDFRDSSRVSGPRSRDRSVVLARLSHTNAITTKRRDAPTTYTRCFPVRD